MPIYEVEAPDGRILEIEGDQLPSEQELDNIFASVGSDKQPQQPEYKQMSLKEVFNATPDELNENMKALGRKRLQQRADWEQAHPFISEIQKSFQPNYRAGVIDMQNQAQYGLQIPFGQMIKSDFKKIGQNLVPSINLATIPYTGGLMASAKGLIPSIGRGMLQGGIQGGVEGLTSGIADEGLSVEALKRGLGGTGAGAIVGGLVPIATKPFEFAVNTVGRVAKGVGTGALETFGIGKDAFNRMKVSPRGSDISKNYEQLGSEEFINDVANKFKNGVQELRNQEITNFAKARDNLISQNKDVTVDLTPYTQKAFDKIKSLGFLNENGLTPAGKNATNLTKFLDDLDYYNSRPFDISELQSLKSDVLDNIIDYTPQAGQKLNNSTRALQKVAKEMRKDINNILNEKLGSEYGAINKKLSDVLEIIDNNPELKDLTNAQSITTLSGKLKKAGTVRTQTAKELKKLEQVMNENGIKISDYSLMDDILDYNAAKKISNSINTGLAGGLANMARRAVAQPIVEEIINQQGLINPAINAIQNVGRKIKPAQKVLQSPALYSGLSVPLLQGGVAYNEDRY